MGKFIERAIANHIQVLLEDTDFIDPFQLGFRPAFGMKSALISLHNDFPVLGERWGDVTLTVEVEHIHCG